MRIKIERQRIDYRFYNPANTCEILFMEIFKKSKWEFNRKRNREEKIDWWYECKNDFEKNINLLFSKFIPEGLDEGEDKENKDKYLQLVIKEFENLKMKWQNFFDSVKKRNERFLEDLRNCGFNVKPLTALCPWRLVIGLGASHPQETSMTLHHIYGIPYIPGSAVKGITRHWAVLKFAEEKANKGTEDFEKSLKLVSDALEKGEDIKLNVDGINFKDLIEIFGTQEQAGKVIFMDAYPLENINLKIDIMNVHYPDYYSGEKPPADWQNPKPIKFLTVENTKFQFYLIGKDKDLIEKAIYLLKEALKETGIGAKTSLGYGIFEI
ncbi:MAG: type III-B CRISPR module RAMP protein Cmr6 [Candidatus Omnitrophica bacterium]|nr:type III-B CRISPR module RAMP protein Cmr6 [Candidatus Omnitrophota bacterium]